MEISIEQVSMWTVNLLIVFNLLAHGVHSEKCPNEPKPNPYKPHTVPTCCQMYPSDPDLKKEQEKIFTKRDYFGRRKVPLVAVSCDEVGCPKLLGEECSGNTPSGEISTFGKCDPGIDTWDWLKCKCDCKLENGGRNCTYADEKEQPVNCRGRCVPHDLFRNNTDRFVAKDVIIPDVKDYGMISTCQKPDRAPACELMETDKISKIGDLPMACNGSCEVTYGQDIKHVMCAKVESNTASTNKGVENEISDNIHTATCNRLSDKGGYLIAIIIVVAQVHIVNNYV